MKAICPSCGTTYEGRETEDGIEAHDAIYGAWTLSCPSCGAPNLERPEPGLRQCVRRSGRAEGGRR